MKLRQSLWVLLSSVLLLFSGCDHPASWGGTAPQESQEPDYVSFFGADTVHDIYIELEEEDWQEILEDPEAKEYQDCQRDHRRNNHRNCRSSHQRELFHPDGQPQ